MEAKGRHQGRLPMSPRQRAVYECFRQRLVTDGCMPTLATVARELGVARPTVFEHVQNLLRKGWMRQHRKSAARPYSLTNTCPTCGHHLSDKGAA